MFNGISNLLKNIKILTEASVLLGVALLIYYWSITISFFPPALSLGDVAKLLVVASVGAFTFSILTLWTITFGAFPLVLFIYVVPRFGVPFGWRRHFLQINKTIRHSDLLVMAVAGAFFLPIYLMFSRDPVSFRVTGGILLAALAFLFLTYYQMSISGPPWKETDEEQLDRQRDSKISVSVCLVFGVVSALVFWGGPNAFLFATMKQAGVMTLNQSVFLQKEYCPLLGAAFDIEYHEGYCYVEGVDILFQGMGERVLLAELSKGYRVSLPSSAIFSVDGFSHVDNSWTPETTKPAQGGLSH